MFAELKEKLPSLKALGYLNAEGLSATPWDPYQVVLQQEQSVIPSWEHHALVAYYEAEYRASSQ